MRVSLKIVLMDAAGVDVGQECLTSQRVGFRKCGEIIRKIV